MRINGQTQYHRLMKNFDIKPIIKTLSVFERLGSILRPTEEMTYCPDCEKVYFESELRTVGFINVNGNHVEEDHCPKCGAFETLEDIEQ